MKFMTVIANHSNRQCWLDWEFSDRCSLAVLRACLMGPWELLYKIRLTVRNSERNPKKLLKTTFCKKIRVNQKLIQIPIIANFIFIRCRCC